ncbi:MAG: hypothetical protein R2839_01330 [Thermomicrobiales bacterium]
MASFAKRRTAMSGDARSVLGVANSRTALVSAHTATLRPGCETVLRNIVMVGHIE